MLTRRDFVRSVSLGAALAPAGAPLLRWLPRGDDRCVVVIELLGGNDGLNTLIPIDDAAYAQARPTLAKVRQGAHRVAPGFALHPSLGPLADLFARGELAAVHGVGYAKPDRSHFRSRDIWHAADPDLDRARTATTGWLGRAADWLAARGASVPALGLGGLEVPLALRGAHVVAPVLRRLEDYALLVPHGDEAARRAGLRTLVADAKGDGELAAFARDVARAAVDDAERLQKALDGYRASVAFPDNDLGRALQLTSRVLVSGFGTRLCHVPQDGFDTHARQAPAQAGLLTQLGAGLAALVADLRAHGALERTAILVHSEFGRRVAENASQGTDHGAAAPVFVGGGGVRQGLHGTAPDLTKLDDGDVVVTTDFRAVYAAFLRRIGVPVDGVLKGRGFGSIELFA